VKSLLGSGIAAGALVVTGLVSTGLAGSSLSAAPSPRSPGHGCDPAPRLTEVTGTFSRSGETWAVDGTQVDFGPIWYLPQPSDVDYDGDGSSESFTEELGGLVGATVTLSVEARGDAGDRDVYTVNGMTYREPDGCPPAWAGGLSGRPQLPVPPGDQTDHERGEPASPEGKSRRNAALAFATDMKDWTACVRGAALKHKGPGPFGPFAPCGAKPTPPGRR